MIEKINFKIREKIYGNLILILIFFVILFNIFPHISYAEEIVNDIEIKVGFEGGPYYTKKIINESTMNAIAGNKDFEWYVHRGEGGSLKYDYVRGVDLKYLIENISNLDLGSIKRYSIVTTDGYIEENKGITNDYLFNTQRFYYPDAYKSEIIAGEGFQQKISKAPLLAIESLDGAHTFDIGKTDIEDFENRMKDIEENHTGITSNRKYRLMLGMTDKRDENTARYSAQKTKGIVCILGGAPTPEISDEAILNDDKKLGSENGNYQEFGDELTGKDGKKVKLEIGDEIDTDKFRIGIKGGEKGKGRDQSEQDSISSEIFNEALEENFGKGNAPKVKIYINGKEVSGKIKLTEDMLDENGNINFDFKIVDPHDGKEVNLGGPEDSKFKKGHSVKIKDMPDKENPGGETGENPGGETGENPGGEIGENPGGETGENPGGETGENPGGETGENPGGETDENQDGQTDGKSGKDNNENIIIIDGGGKKPKDGSSGLNGANSLAIKNNKKLGKADMEKEGSKSSKEKSKGKDESKKDKKDGLEVANNTSKKSTAPVQNWRVYELGDDAVAMPNIKSSRKPMIAFLIISIILGLAGYIFEIRRFKKSL